MRVRVKYESVFGRVTWRINLLASTLALRAIMFCSGCMMAASALLGFLVNLKLFKGSTTIKLPVPS